MATKKTQPKSEVKAVKALKANTAIILNPRITEKAAKYSEKNTYAFDVAFGATKSEIKKAFILKYNQTPIKVNVINAKPQYVFRRNILGKSARTKKAYVYLPKGVTIDIA